MNHITANLYEHRILVVDDEDEHLNLLKEVLEILHNAVVCTASSSREAVAQLETFQPTLILADIALPTEDDVNLVEALRQYPEAQELPIFALAPYATRNEGQRMLEAGFDAYLSNPFDVPTLGTQLEMLLSFITVSQDYDKKAA